MSSAQFLSLIVFLPALAAILIGFLPRAQHELIRLCTLLTTLVVAGMTVYMAIPGNGGLQFDTEQAGMQFGFNFPWIPTFKIEYFMAADGISFPLLLLTSLITLMAMIASWSVTKHVKGFCILFLLLETGMLGVFLALDFFLFYVFWEVMLLPMYFLIGIWGGPRKEYAAIKFFLYTLFGSVLMLIAILMLYYASDLKSLDATQLARALVPQATVDALPTALGPVHTFNMLALAEMGQTTELFDGKLWGGYSLQHWAFVLLFIGFAIKVPSVPLHTWLPDAHVEAPTPISMILAGVLLKMGGYGILRICYPICPKAGFDLAYVVCLIGVVSMVYGAFAALAQKDFKRLVAYSSVSHMGYVVLGMGVWTLSAVPNAQTLMPNWADFWNQGVQGAMFQMIAHGISSAGMFFMVGVVYDRVHHRNLDQFGGLYGKMPLYTALAMGIFFAGLGLPGLCGFIGEVLVVLSVWNFSHALAVISAFVVILTAGYILWCIQRVYLGPEYKGPHGDHLTPITARELCVAIPLFVAAIWFGIFPNSMLKYMDKTVTQQVQQLATWSVDYAKTKATPADTTAMVLPSDTGK
jgi:NADH-quinone oxidoreductase subunit M